MGMKETYAKDKVRYSTTDDLIRKGKLGDVWKIHPDNPNRVQAKKKTNSVNA